MNKNLFKNNASSILNVGLGLGATEVSVTPGSEVLFPFIDEEGDYFISTIVDTSGNFEIVRVTATTGNLFTIERAQENTIARDFPTGSIIEMRLTAESLETLRDVPVATETSFGTVTIATDDEIEMGIKDTAVISTSGLKKLGVINVHLLKQMPQLFTGTFDRIYPVGKDGVTDTDWQICDGTNGTPDLRGLFIKGGDGTNTGETGGSESHLHTIEDSVGNTSLSSDQIPSHSHGGALSTQTILTGTGFYTSEYMHGAVYNHASPPLYDTPPTGTVRPLTNTSVIGGSQAHTHSLEVDTQEASSLPPYYTLAYIMYIGE